MSELYCTYCARPQGERISCCQENHWMTAQEYRDYHGEWPDDTEERDEETGEPVEDYQSEAALQAFIEKHQHAYGAEA